jgi:predicted nucleotidyltransferase component of viral defense system
MNNIISNFSQIVSFAKEYGLPISKKRAILREYLQSKIINILYQQRISRGIFFIGGTSLRLLYNLDRFSEDLDFDYDKKIKPAEIQALVVNVQQRLIKENILCQLYQNEKVTKNYYELRFPDLLGKLKISSNQQEKLMIKLDFDCYFQHLSPIVKLFNRYGFLNRVSTIDFDTYLVQKMVAYQSRKQTQPRDLYDLVWLLSHKAKPNQLFLTKNKIEKNLIKQCIQKFSQEKTSLNKYQQRLKPFLFEEKNSKQIEFLPELLRQFLN